MSNPIEILDKLLLTASANLSKHAVRDREIRERIEYVCGHTHFVNVNRLPLNPTTAFLTPAFRNLDRPLTPDVELIGRPRQLYQYTIQLLDDVHAGRVTAKAMLMDIIRTLLIMRDEKLGRMNTLLAGLQHAEDTRPLSSEEIVTLIEQHLSWTLSICTLTKNGVS